MTEQITLHPTQEMLAGFASGSLPAGLTVAISAHVERCSACRHCTSEMEAESTVAWLQDSDKDEAANDQDFSHMIDAIISEPQQQAAVVDSEAFTEIHVHERSVTLPRVLAKVASEGLVWKNIGGGINQAQVVLDDETQCEFIYMKPGSQVPVHRHQGNEITLVLDGSFSDEMGEYKASDFVQLTSSHQHQPTSEEGCLCFAVIDSPLTFTKGGARLMNPFLRYKFRKATSQRV